MSPLSRRTFSGLAVLGFAGMVAGAAAGCDESSAPRSEVQPSGVPTGTGGPAPTTAPGPDVDIVAAAVAANRALQASYRGLTRAHPTLRPQVDVLADQLGEHLLALGEAPSPVLPLPRTPRRAARALAAVRDAEVSARAGRGADSLVAESGDLARVLASMAGCHAQHVDVLGDVLGEALAGTR